VTDTDLTIALHTSDLSLVDRPNTYINKRGCSSLYVVIDELLTCNIMVPILPNIPISLNRYAYHKQRRHSYRSTILSE